MELVLEPSSRACAAISFLVGPNPPSSICLDVLGWSPPPRRLHTSEHAGKWRIAASLGSWKYELFYNSTTSSSKILRWRSSQTKYLSTVEAAIQKRLQRPRPSASKRPHRLAGQATRLSPFRFQTSARGLERATSPDWYTWRDRTASS